MARSTWHIQEMVLSYWEVKADVGKLLKGIYEVQFYLSYESYPPATSPCGRWSFVVFDELYQNRLPLVVRDWPVVRSAGQPSILER